MSLNNTTCVIRHNHPCAPGKPGKERERIRKFEGKIPDGRDERERECILKAQVPGVSMRHPLSTDADDLLRCGATVGNSGERGEPDILT